MKYPNEIIITTTPESDKAAGLYTDSRNCRLCQALKLKYPDVDIEAGAWAFDINYVKYEFNDETADQIRNGYNCAGTKVRPDAEPVTVVARRVK